jgi:hypothetical protein|tara:strand:- start:160 stop:312 length:153 start_codon:yes stop_codon:yes gene_type:complete
MKTSEFLDEVYFLAWGSNDPYTYDMSFEKTLERLKDEMGFEYDNQEENDS